MTDYDEKTCKATSRNNRWALLLLLVIGGLIVAGIFFRPIEVFIEIDSSDPLTPLVPDPVTAHNTPMRIVAANTGAADILSEMIDPKRLAAVPAQVEDYASDPAFWKTHAAIPRFEKFHAESILGFRPDLVISSAFQDGVTAAAIEQQHVPILFLKDFESLDGIRNSIDSVGKTVNAQAEAQKMLAKFDAELKTVAVALKGKLPVSVIVYSNFGTGYTVGSGVCQDDILTRAGGRNLAAEHGMKGNAPITFEQLLRIDPEFIVVAGDDGLNSPQAKLLLNEPALKELRAVKNRKIAVVHQRWFDALSQYAVFAVKEIAEQLHPELKQQRVDP